jgi:hypothetical protein
MSTPDRPKRLLRAAVILSAVLYAAAATPLAGQQATDSARLAPASSAQASSSQASAPSTTPGPRLSTNQFQRFEPTLARNDAPASSPVTAQGSHVIVISTLVLVLAVIIIVLLVVR